MKQIKTRKRSATFSLSLLVAAIPTLLTAQAGDLVTSYANGPGANSRISCSAVQVDGKLVIGGTFTGFAGTSRKRIARLTENGLLDTSFDPGTGASSTVNEIAMQPDGKIIIGGQFSSYNGVLQRSIARLNSDGSLDLTFISGLGFNGIVTAVDVLPSGRIMVAGWFTSYNGIPRPRIARLNSNGTLDLTFDPGVGPDAAVLCMKVATDGKVYIGGSFATISGTSRNGVARLLADGANDPTFSTGTGLNSPGYALAIQPDGKLIIGGPFTDYNGASRPRVARILETGAVDPTFKPVAGFNSWVYSLDTQPGGRILCGGDFTSYNGVSANRIALLNSDGSKDIDFLTGTGFNNWVYDTQFLPEGDIVVLGGFSSYNGTARGMVAKLESGCTEELKLTFETDAIGSQTTWQLIADGYTYPVCQGTGMADNSTVQTGCCVPSGSYKLKVFDSAGDGIANGGYVLTDRNGKRIIDNRNNFTNGSVSAIMGDQAFSTEMGTDDFLFLLKDKVDWTPSGEYLVCNANPLVSAQFGITNTTSGYEYWFFDPNGSYSFRRFLSHATNDLYGNAELRACHLRVNNWSAANHIPSGVMMNVRVRGHVAGVALPWGPACRFKIDPSAADCPSTKLVWDPTSVHFSCGVTRSLAQRVIAQPLRGANKYKFKFVNVADGYDRESVSNNYIRTLNLGAPALVPGRTYQVSVAVSYDNGVTYCPYGEACDVTIAGSMMAPPPGNPVHVLIGAEQAMALTVWPNPTTGSSINLSIDLQTELEAPLMIRVMDVSGRIVHQEQKAVQGTIYYSTMDFQEQLSYGTYFIEATSGEYRTTQRFMVAY